MAYQKMKLKVMKKTYSKGYNNCYTMQCHMLLRIARILIDSSRFLSFQSSHLYHICTKVL